MSRVVWNETGKRYFESGVDRGVLYVSGQPGVAWNGLISVNEEKSSLDPESLYYDGEKYLDYVSGSEDFSATIEAFSAPESFSRCDGRLPLANGLYATGQRRETFAMTYRTLVGNDVDEFGHGYKIHFVYNATATPSSRINKTLAEVPDPSRLQWKIETVPVHDASTYKPTAHLILDTRKVDQAAVDFIENLIYGSASGNPTMMTQEDLIGIVEWLG